MSNLLEVAINYNKKKVMKLIYNYRDTGTLTPTIMRILISFDFLMSAFTKMTE